MAPRLTVPFCRFGMRTLQAGTGSGKPSENSTPLSAEPDGRCGGPEADLSGLGAKDAGAAAEILNTYGKGVAVTARQDGDDRQNRCS